VQSVASQTALPAELPAELSAELSAVRDVTLNEPLDIVEPAVNSAEPVESDVAIMITTT
jgi:hypothetical protein